MKTIPTDGKLRLQYPIYGGCLAYFPAAIVGVARHSYIAGAKYNDGGLVHLRYVGNDHPNSIQRHLMDISDLQAAKARGEANTQVFVYNFETKTEELLWVSIDEAILTECNALCWRALAISQELHEQLAGKPLAPAARTKPDDPSSIKLLSYDLERRIPAIKALRTIGNLSLREALDAINGPLPVVVLNKTNYTREQLCSLCTAAGISIE